ncbi:MAG: Dabb family protein [Clostridiales bacterium]|nr:Dabb family protein [Clostridiales bacterium]
MIKHIVCFKLKEGESVDKAVEVLKSMEGKVPSALKIEVGKDFLHTTRSYDIILQVTINSREELDVYQKDEYHCSVVKKYMHAVVQSSVAVDYDI